jgi:hypothetical protein
MFRRTVRKRTSFVTGYPLPAVVDPPDTLYICVPVPDEPMHRAAFLGQILELAHWYTWDKDDAHTGKDVAAVWMQIWLCVRDQMSLITRGCGCPDDGALHRYTSGGVYQTSTDGGTTWSDDPDGDPRNDGVASPPLGGSGDSTKCAAADNARDVFKNFRDQDIELLTAGTTVLAIVAGMVGALGVILGLTGAATGIGVLLIGFAAGLLSLTPESVADQLDDDVMDEFRCILFCHVEDNGQWTYADWLAVLDDLPGTFSGFPLSFFQSITQGMGYIGLSNAGVMGAATADDCDCECAACDHPEDFVYQGTVIGTVTNLDGSITVEIAAIFTGGTQYVINWGDAVPGSSCCCLTSFEWVTGEAGTPNFVFKDCASAISSGSTFMAGDMLGFQITQSFAETTPFTAKITFVGEGC